MGIGIALRSQRLSDPFISFERYLVDKNLKCFYPRFESNQQFGAMMFLFIALFLSFFPIKRLDSLHNLLYNDIVDDEGKEINQIRLNTILGDKFSEEGLLYNVINSI